MEEYQPYPQAQPGNQIFSDVSLRLKDIEEKQRLLKDRVLLIGRNLVEEREKTFEELQLLKKEVFIMKEETVRMRGLMQKIADQFANLAKKEELLILQRQFDMIKELK